MLRIIRKQSFESFEQSDRLCLSVIVLTTLLAIFAPDADVYSRFVRARMIETLVPALFVTTSRFQDPMLLCWPRQGQTTQLSSEW